MNELDYRVAIEALENHVAQTRPIYETSKAIDYLKKAHKKALAQPEQYAKGYADAMNWKVQNHLEHLPAAQKLAEWKFVPKEPTREMLEAMDECSMEGYDEHLYAGHAASVYMAAVDVAPIPPQPKEPEQEPVAWMHPDGRLWTFGKGFDKSTFTIPLYTTPPQRKPLSEEQIDAIAKQHIAEGTRSFEAFARAIEAAHGIKE
jgi:hypothetical protein